MATLGEHFKEARERRRLSLEKVEEETRIRAPLLRAMEEDRLDLLPERVYAKGLLRTYARFLGLEVGEVMRLYGEEEPPLPPPPSFVSTPSLISLDIWIFLILVLGTLVAAFFFLSQSLVTNPLSTPTPPGATQASSPASTQVLTLEAIRPTFVRVEADGEVVFQGAVEAGQQLTWTAEEGLRITVRDGGAVLVRLNGRNLGPLGEPGEVVIQEWNR